MVALLQLPSLSLLSRDWSDLHTSLSRRYTRIATLHSP